MYCKNCCKVVEANATVCLGCGYKVGDGNNYCSNCGEPMEEGETVCLVCGRPYNFTVKQEKRSKEKSVKEKKVKEKKTVSEPKKSFVSKQKSTPIVGNGGSGGKSKWVAFFLALFFGYLGAHNFYLGHSGRGFAQIVLNCIGISPFWAFIEAILILVGKINKDASGKYLK